MWVPIALSRDVPPGATRAVILGGEERVIWRADSGGVHVWEDRCPHRGMRLSFGFVRGQGLNCLYHGWEYGTSASCRRIPAHPDLTVPATIKANAFECAEAGDMIWTSVGEPVPLPTLATSSPLATMAVDAPIEIILALTAAVPYSGAQVFAAELDGIALQIGWHVAAADRTMLHAGMLGDGDPLTALHSLRALRANAEAVALTTPPIAAAEAVQ